MYRRDFLFILSALAALPACTRSAADRLQAELAALEKNSGGRLGVCIHDFASNETSGHRMDERFGMCSTFKLPLAGFILRDIDAGRLTADQLVPYSEDDLVPYAPVTRQHLAKGGMKVLALARAAQITSDNLAANLLLDLIGGPSGFTARLRELGDEQTRLDRYEPEMNLVPAREVRDTTTPRAMAHTVAKFVHGSVLTPESRDKLVDWTRATMTGRRRIRAGLPDTWQAGDKTGTAYAPGMANKHNDVAVVWPGASGALVISGYYEADDHYDEIRAEDDAVLAEVGRLAAGGYQVPSG
jgi:beta-lactamase class A